MPRKYLILVAVVVLAGAAFALNRQSGAEVKLGQVTRGPAVELVYATGIIEPVLSADVAPEVTARLVTLLVDEGQEVAQGQPLARLEDTEQQAEVAELTAKVSNAEIELKRAESLWNRRSGSREDFDRAQSQLQQDQAKLQAAQQRLAKRTLTAPFAGPVLRRDGQVGETLAQGRRVFVIGEKAPLRAELEVDEEDIVRVVPGQKVLISADAFPGQVFESHVATITPQGDSDSKSYRVRALLAADTPLPVGMTVEANVVLSEKQDVLLLPSDALARRAATDVVFIADGRSVRQQSVSVGIRGAILSEVTAGVEAGQSLVLNPPETLADGAHIRTRKD